MRRQPPVPERAPTIIAIEDNLADRQLLRRAVEGVAPGVLLSVYSTVEEGVGAAAFFNPRCIVLDWNMPGEGGAAAIARLRREAVTADVPVVVLTGADDEATRSAALAAGAAEVVHKGASLEAMALKLLAACGL